jgi:hypothetical protein
MITLKLNDKEKYTHFEMKDETTSWYFNGGIVDGPFSNTENPLLENYEILFEEEYMKILRRHGFLPSNMKLLAINFGRSTNSDWDVSTLLLKSIRTICKMLKLDAIAWAPGLTELDEGEYYEKEISSYFTPIAQTGVYIIDTNKRFPSTGLTLL